MQRFTRSSGGCFIFFAGFFLISAMLFSQASAEPMSAPSGKAVYSYVPAPEPRKLSDPSLAMPIGIGNMALGQGSCDFKVGFADFSEPVDIYLAIYIPSLSTELFMITKDSGLQPISQGMAKWRESASTALDDQILTGIPVSSLPDGDYYFYAMATRPGSLDTFYLWQTGFTLPLSKSPALGAVGALPQQAAVPGGSIDQMAAALATQVFAGGSGSLPALITAYQAAGITVNGASSAPTGDASQGLSIDAYELQFISLLLNFGLTMPLEDVASDLVASGPGLLGGDTLKGIILDGIRDQAQNGTGPHRFWARFIAELGKQSASPYDLLNSTVTSAPLNAVQMDLILRRLAADITVIPGFRAAAAPVMRKATGAGSPCEFTNPVSDWVAAASKYGFGKVAGYLDKLNGVVDPTGGMKFGQSVVNTGLAYLKLFAQMGLYDGKIALTDNNPPLHRTKYTGKNGEQRNLTFTARYNGDNLQWANCFRMVFNAMGLDMSIPNGPIKGADVQWKAYNTIVQFASGADPVHGNITDDSGQTRVDVEGLAQKTNLSERAKAVNKNALFATETAVKMTKPKDAVDIATSVPGGAKFLLTLPIKLFERTHWMTASYALPVEDWTDDVLYTGTAKATMLFPSTTTKVWEITANVTFAKDPNYTTQEMDVYTTAEGSLTQTMYTVFDPTGYCWGDPYSFTDTYPIYQDDGYLSIKTAVEPLQYNGNASISFKTPVKEHFYYRYCKDGTVEQKTMKVNEQQHAWLLTAGAGAFISALPDGTLKGTYKQPYGASFEWELRAADNNLP